MSLGTRILSPCLLLVIRILYSFNVSLKLLPFKIPFFPSRLISPSPNDIRRPTRPG